MAGNGGNVAARIRRMKKACSVPRAERMEELTAHSHQDSNNPSIRATTSLWSISSLRRAAARPSSTASMNRASYCQLAVDSFHNKLLCLSAGAAGPKKRPAASQREK